MTAAFNPARSGQPVTLNEAPDKELSTSDCRCCSANSSLRAQRWFEKRDVLDQEGA